MLVASSVTVSVAGRVLLRRVSVDVRPGELLILLGENGAGKSTLLRVLCGDCVPEEGGVMMNGRPLAAWRLRDRARVRAVLPQDAQVAFGFTALEVALLGRYPFCDGVPRRADYDVARSALARVGAGHLENRLVPTLSGGEKSRVQLARVLAQVGSPGAGKESRYLLLDEPTASLDLAHQHAVLELARGLAEGHGLGVLAVLHDLNLAARYAHRLALLKAGCLVAAGEPAAVLTAERIADCFGIRARVERHPVRACPLVVVS
jgi:iron complex transport system ATP-binding protein